MSHADQTDRPIPTPATSRSPELQQRARGAVTLLELLVGVVVGTLVVLMAVSHVIRHQRAFDAVSSDIDLRNRLRDASDLLTGDLRGASSVGDSILAASDTAVEFYSAIGASTVCTTPSATRVTLPPDTLASGRTLSGWVVTPDTGDYAVIFNDSSPSVTSGWTRARVVSFGSISTAIGCPASAALLAPSDVSANRSYELDVASPFPAGIRHGSPVRFIRRVRYNVYRAGDGKWYVGYRRCSAGCAPVQPVSGPYEGVTGPPLRFRYFRRNGAALAGNGPTTDVARVEIVSHARYARPLRLPGHPLTVAAESSVVTVTLRNR